LLMRATPNEPTGETSTQARPEQETYPRVSLLALLRSWEFYLVIIAAAFLRLYQFNTTEFDDDQAAVYQMAYNAVHHGYLVATGNVASIHLYNPPAIIYLFMLPAAFTANPLRGAIMVAVLMTISVILTYIFVRRYYGRTAATIAALTYATAFRAIVYSRFIWNQNLLPFFVILMVMALFHGVVARKRGWLAPALLLLGLLIQLHGSGVFMVIPLALALVLAPGTIRKRDIALGIGLLLIIYAPYLLWELSAHLADIAQLLHGSPQKSAIDGLALQYYAVLLNPYDVLSTQNPLHGKVVPYIGENSYLGQLSPYLGWISQGAAYLLALCIVLVLFLAIRSKRRNKSDAQNGRLLYVKNYWQELRASPYRCGLIILLGWQIVPLAFLLRHSLTLYLHYFIIFLPGPFILLGIGLSQTATWLQARDGQKLAANLLRYGILGVAAVLILAQGIGSIAGIADLGQGHYSDGSNVNNLYNDLRSLQRAVNAADQLAQEQHLSRVYISTDWPTQSTLRFLSTQMHTPATLFNDQGCVVLPGADEGPAVMLVGPYDNLTDALVQQFASVTLISQPARPGGAPFRLYIVNTRPLAPATDALLGNDLQLLNAPAQPFTLQQKNWLVSQWELVRSAPPAYRQVYGYTIMQQAGASGQPAATNQCNVTALRSGDRVLLPLQQGSARPGQQGQVISVQVGAYVIHPYYLTFGPLTFETYKDISTPTIPLKTANGQEQLAIPIG
jgi:4-amino-4-deoxy-L-arabinose transferase-like glycosyltransferase